MADTTSPTSATGTVPADRLWDATETADYLGLKAESVVRLARAGVLPGGRVGEGKGVWRFAPDEIRAYFAARCAEARTG